MPYRALREIYIPIGEFTPSGQSGAGKEFYRVEWRPLGFCSGIKDAKEKFGGSPVLEMVGRLQ
jgi:hypothetical protein